MPTNWWDGQNAATLKFDPKKSEAAFSTVSLTSINAYRKQLVTSYSVWLEMTDVPVKFGDSRLKSGQIIRLFAGRARSTYFRVVT